MIRFSGIGMKKHMMRYIVCHESLADGTTLELSPELLPRSGSVPYHLNLHQTQGNEGNGLYNLNLLQDVAGTKTQFRHVLCELGYFISLIFSLN